MGLRQLPFYYCIIPDEIIKDKSRVRLSDEGRKEGGGLSRGVGNSFKI